MKKSIFIIPGFREQVSDSQYQWMIKYYREKGYVVQKVPINWNYRLMSDYVQEFSSFSERYRTEENHVIGFSYGAMIAFISANGLKPDSLALCSLSPYFKEDLKSLKPWWIKDVGENRIRDFKKYEAIKIARLIKTPTVVFYGTVEGKKYPQIKMRCEESAEYIQGAKLVVVKNAPHKINHPAYIEAIKEALF